jgi:hypothetical protein
MDTIDKIINNQDALLRKVASDHNQLGHACQVYNNFVNCDCGFHAHTAGMNEEYLIKHNAAYTIYEHIS